MVRRCRTGIRDTIILALARFAALAALTSLFGASIAVGTEGPAFAQAKKPDKKAEDARKAEEARKAEDARKAEEEAAAKKAEEDKAAEDAKHAEGEDNKVAPATTSPPAETWDITDVEEVPDPPGPDIPIAAKLGTFDPLVGLPSGVVALEWRDPVTENPSVGDSELWEVFNFTEDAHPIHIHEVLFQVVDLRFDASECRFHVVVGVR